MSKKALRKSVLQRMAVLKPIEIKTQSTAVANTLTNLPEFKSATNVSLYMSMPHEVDTMAIINECFAQNKKVFLPKTSLISGEKQHPNQKRHLEMLRVQNMQAVRTLQPRGPYNLYEPETGNSCFEYGGLDLIVLPGVAFSKECARLGYGVGYYDSFIQEHLKKTGKKPFLLGIGFKEQLEDSIPTEPHDELLDGVLLGNSWYTHRF